MIIKDTEEQLVREALSFAKNNGANMARATLAISSENLVATLNGEIDRITRCLDSSLSLSLFVDGRYGTYSTNKLETNSLQDFILKAINTTKMLSPDECRHLPDINCCCQVATRGDELDLVDNFYHELSPEIRTQVALSASAFGTDSLVISEEGEYSDSIYDVLLMDTNGLVCRHCETSFDYGVEITIEADGEKYSGYWWDSSCRFDALKAAECGLKAIEKAKAQIGSEAIQSGKYNMVIDREVAYKAVSPILGALSGGAIQQNHSFLMDSLNQKLFPEGMTIMDVPHIKGQCCSKLFDAEGVRTAEGPVIEKGVVKEYFINTYMSEKLKLPPTKESCTRAKLLPWPKAGLNRDDILRICSEGILVTDFNGGNFNQATGDFSYGVEGFLFKEGKIVKPISGMLVTGNYLSLWQGLIAAGDDARSCMSKLIPTLAFSNVDFSG